MYVILFTKKTKQYCNYIDRRVMTEEIGMYSPWFEKGGVRGRASYAAEVLWMWLICS